MPAVSPTARGAERLQKVLAAAGIASRRQCETLITTGRVRVNGTRVTELGTRIDPAVDKVTLDGRPVSFGTQYEYWAVNKPPGVLSTVRDDRGRPTVVELVREPPARIVPVGRLDLDAQGLLLLTNDGELMNRLLHPSYGVTKEYRVLVDGVPNAAAIEQMHKGAEVEGQFVAPLLVRVDQTRRGGPTQTWLTMVLAEGRKREIKVICQGAGHPVVRLMRVRFGPIKLGTLSPSAYRRLRVEEVQALKRVAKLS